MTPCKQGHSFRALVLLIATLLLMAAPVAAQTPTSTPRPSAQGELASATRELADASERIGTANVVTIGTLVGVLLIGGITFRPLLKSNSEAYKQLADSNRQMGDFMRDFMAWRSSQQEREHDLDETRRQQSQAVKLGAEAQERTALLMSQMETKNEAQQSRNTAVEAINQHTSAELTPIQAHLKHIDERLEAVTQKLDKIPTREELDGNWSDVKTTLNEIRDELNEVHQLVTATPIGLAEPLGDPDPRFGCWRLEEAI